jgi:ATP-dependent protease HslVU (ClpYQ) peptidase subunit
MTCIVGLKTPKGVFMGGDSAGISPGTLEASIVKQPKVFHRPPFVIGYAGSFRLGQVLEYDFQPPEIGAEDRRDLMRYMVSKFVPRLREAVKDSGAAVISGTMEFAGAFLVGVYDRLFEVQDNFQIIEVSKRYNAIGAGATFAVGAMHLAESAGISKSEPEWAVKAALEAAAEHSIAVRPPFVFVQGEGRKGSKPAANATKRKKGRGK